MRALLPQPADDVDLVKAYAVPEGGTADDRPFVRCNMISTLDGAITLNGRSGMLGGPADRQVFGALRSLTDVVLVGAGTARAESYGPVRFDADVKDQRVGRGQSPVPPIALVTRAADFDWSSPLFTQAEVRPIVFTTNELTDDNRRKGEGVADFVVAGDDRVRPGLVLDHLHGLGYRSVLLEGGPALNADVVQGGLLDELCLTLSPCLVAGDGPRVLAGPERPVPLDMDIVHVLEQDGFLFLRLAVRPDGPA